MKQARGANMRSRKKIPRERMMTNATHGEAHFFEHDSVGAEHSHTSESRESVSIDGPPAPRSDGRASITSFLHPNIGTVSSDEGGEGGGRLIVVSNRVALPKDIRAGGLASALKGALAERGGIWFGWSGDISEQPRF